MSLLSNWENKKSKIQTAKEWSDMIINHQIGYDNKNCWQCRDYKKSLSTAPTLEDIDGMTPLKTMIKADMNNYTSWGWDDSYIGYMQCYVHCTSNQSLSCQFYTDDAGRLYLNDVSRATSESCKWTDVVLNFKKGWNKIQILFQEGSGGDGAALNTKLSTQTFIDAMYANIHDDTTSI